MPRISELPSTSAPTTADTMPIVQSGVTKNTTLNSLPVSAAANTAINNVQTNLNTHTSNTSNPHSVTQAQVGLGNVNNTSDVNKPVSTAQQTAINSVYSFRNRIINGNFAINQRGVSGTVTLAAGAYGHDRWKAGSGGCTYTFATANNVTTLTITAGTLQQIIEGGNLLSGTHSLSWTGTAQGRINAGAYSASGVQGSATGGTNLTIEFGTGTVSLVQFEPGTQVTSFELRPLSEELVHCQRYYESTSMVVATSVGATAPLSTAYWKVTKRVSPSLTVSFDSGTGATIVTLGNNGALTGVYQNGAHSVQATALVAGSAEL